MASLQLTAPNLGVQLAVEALAVYRLTILTTQDVITEAARQKVKSRFGPGAYDFVTCPWCTSVWIAAGALAARRVAPRLWRTAAEGLMFSAVSGFMAERS